MQLLLLVTACAFAGALFDFLPGGTAVQKALIIVTAGLSIAIHRAALIPIRALTLVLPLVAFMVLSAFSALFHSGSLLYTLTASSPFLLGILLYLFVVSIPGLERNLHVIRKAFYCLLVAQIAFAFVKLGVHGIDEKVLIGTMSNRAGQLGFMIPAIGVPVVVFLMTPRNRVMSYASIVGLFCFGIINEKRAVIFLLPFILIASLIANRGEDRVEGRRVGLSSYIVIFVVIAAGVALGIRSIPSLNPEESYDGGVSLSHAAQYALEYLTMDYGGSLQGSYELAARDENVQVGRAIVWLHIFQWLSDSSTWTWMFGNGFGSATPSLWTDSGSDPLFDVIASRGAISGAGLAAVETGLVGLALATYAFMHIGFAIRRCRREARSHTVLRWYRTAAVLLAIFAFDFFFYSTVLLRTMPLPLIFFAILASVVLVRNWERRQDRAPLRTGAVAPIAMPGAQLP